MPAFDLTSALTDPSAMLTADTKYVVQNQSGVPVGFAVATAAFASAPADALVLGPVGPNSNMPSHLEYTYATADHVRVWAHAGVGKVVFHALG